MATTSFITARHRLMDKLDAGQFPIRGTATGGSTTTVVDSGASLSGATADSFDHYWVKISTTTDGLAPQGEIRQISEGGYSAGTFTVPTAFSAAVQSGDTYEIHRGFHPSEMDNALNMMSRNLWVPYEFPLSAHILANDDNDMESTATITGMWTASNVTQTKATSPVYGGAQVLSVAATSDGGYSRPTTNFSVNPNLQYATAVQCALTDGDSARLQLIDVTNSNATIDQTAAVTLTEWQELFIQWTPPSGCRSMQPRLMAVTSSDIAFFDEYQTWIVGTYSYTLPTWVSMRPQVIDIRGVPLGVGSVGGDQDYAALTRRSVALGWTFEKEDWAGANEVRVNVQIPGNVRPVLLARKPIDAVSFDYGTAGTGTTANTIPLTSPQTDVLVEGAYAELCRRIANRSEESERAKWTREATRAEGRYRAGIHQMGLGEPIFRHSTHRVAARIA